MAPIKEEAWTILVQNREHKLLSDWLGSADVSWTCKAIVLDRLYGDADEAGNSITPAMKDMLSKCAGVPGVPRAVYVTYSSDSPETLARYLKLVLEDQSLSEDTVTVLVRRRADIVRQRVEPGSLNLSDKRRVTVTKALRRKVEEEGSGKRRGGKSKN